jgi:hypothetical protein
MGRTNAGIGVRTSTDTISTDEIVNKLFGDNFERSSEMGDIRNNKWIAVEKSKEFFYIQKADYAGDFFSDKLETKLNELNLLFNNPDLIMAYEQYDSGGTYSYAIIKDGNLTRRFRSLSYETTIDEGELEEIEKSWKNAEVKEFILNESEKEITLINNVTGEKCDKGSEPEVILNNLLFNLLKIENPNNPIIECSFYKMKETEVNHTKEKNDNKRPWWKFW